MTEQKLHYYEKIIATTTDLMAFRDAENRYVMVNDQYCRYFDRPLHEIIGHTPDDLFRKENAVNSIGPYSKRCLQGETVHAEEWLDYPGVGRRCMELHYDPFRDATGAVTGLVVSARDITERRQAEQKLRESEEHFREIYESANIGIAMADEDQCITDANAAFCAMLGYSLEELRQLHITDLIHPDDIEARRLTLAVHRKELDRFRSERRYVRKDGSTLWVDVSARSISNQAGAKLSSFAVVSDITERKEAERKLRDSEERFREIFQSANVGIAVADSNERFVEFNETFRAMLGYSPEELRQLHTIDIVHPDDIGGSQRAAEAVRRRETDQQRSERRYVRKDGSTIWVSVSARSVQDAAGVERYSIGVIKDITERKRAQGERERLLDVLEASMNEIYMFAPDTLEFQYVNRAACRNLGYSLEQLRTMTPLDLKPEFTLATFRELIGPLLQRRKEVQIFQTVHRRADASLYPVEVHLQLVECELERVFLAVILDITERKEADRKLRDSEALFREIFRSANIGIAMADGNRRLTEANDAFCALLGYSLEEVRQLHTMDFVHPDDVEASRRLMETARRGRDRFRSERRYVRKDGSVLWVDVSARVMQDESGAETYSLAVVSDITERKQAEQALRDFNASLEQRVAERTQQLAEANRVKSDFLASISHELRTPLNSVIGFSDLLKEGAVGPLNAKQAGFVSDILESGRLLLALVQGILEVSRLDAARVALMREPVDVGSALKERVDVHRMAADARRVSISLDVAADAGCAQLDPQALRRMLDALLDNAIKFNHDGGAVAARARRQDGWVEIAVEDTGIGIAHADLPRLFQPLVQLDTGLARRHGGIGLGLTLAHRLAGLHGGSIEVRSEPGKGSTFTLRLPAGE